MDDVGLTNLKQEENESADDFIHRALSYNKENSVSEYFLVKLTYHGFKPTLQQIVIPQNPTPMSDLLSKAVIAEMTVNITNSAEVDHNLLKAVASLENNNVDKLSERFSTTAS